MKKENPFQNNYGGSRFSTFRSGGDQVIIDPTENALRQEKNKRKSKAEKEKKFVNLEKVNQTLTALKKIKFDDDLTAEEIKEQKPELKKRIKLAKKAISDVYDYVAEYAQVVRKMEAFKSSQKDKLSGKNWRDELKELDESRRRKHNALISTIQGAVRYMREQFSELSESQMEKFEEKMDRQDKMFLEIKRLNFDKNIFMPDWVNLRDRKSIAEWAFVLAEELELQRELEDLQ